MGRAAAEAAAVVGGVIVLTAVLLGPALDATETQLSGGEVLQAAVVLVGLAAGGRLEGRADFSAFLASGTLTGHAAVVPLTLTLLLVTGFAVAARLRHSPSVTANWQAAALTGACTGVLLALLSTAARATTLPGAAEQALASADLSVGVGPLRVLVTGALLATASSGLPRALAAACTAGGGLGAWSRALSAALRTTAVVMVLGSAVVLLVVLLDGGRVDGTAEWSALLAVLPALGLLGAAAAGGATVEAVARDRGDLSDLLSSIGLDTGAGVHRTSYGLLTGGGGPWLWLAALGLAAAVVAVAVRGALLRDPRLDDPGRWWRTAVAFAAVALLVVWLTRASLAVVLQVGSILAGGTSSFFAHAGLSLLPALLSALVLGALSGVAADRVRPVASALPRLLGQARRLPAGLHPAWALLLVDAGARLGHQPPEALRRSAQEAAATADGLDPLPVDASRTRLVSAGLIVIVILGVLLPVAGALAASALHGPRAAVGAYAAALRDGDAAALRDAAQADDGAPSLSSAALAVQRDAAELTDVRPGPVEGSGDVRTAEVSYRVARSGATQQVQVVRSQEPAFGFFPRWEVRAALPTLALVVPSVATGVVVDGERLRAEDVTSGAVPVFPGAVTVTAEVDGPFEVQPWTGVVDTATDEGGVAAPVVSLTASGEQSARSAVQAWLDGCEASTVLTPEGCPLGLGWWRVQGQDQSDVRWAYDPPVGLEVDVDGDGAVTVSGSVQAAVTYTSTRTHFLAAPTSETVTSSKGTGPVNGTVRFDGEEAVFTPTRGGILDDGV